MQSLNQPRCPGEAKLRTAHFRRHSPLCAPGKQLNLDARHSSLSVIAILEQSRSRAALREHQSLWLDAPRPRTESEPMNAPPKNSYLEAFEARISGNRGALLDHPIYGELKDLQTIRVFMKSHVFAVWDFMSLLKTLQRQLTCINIPWLPAKDPQVARFINEIVLGEETDEAGEGLYLSHFELYLRAMEEVGADTGPVLHFLGRVRETPDFDTLVKELSREHGVFDFLQTTFEQAHGKPHEVAAAFLFGREDIIPEMFTRIMKTLHLFYSEEYRFFRQYLERHIEVDGDHHGPLARKMLLSLCGDSAMKWQEAEHAAVIAIEARIKLWDLIRSELSLQKVAAGPQRG